MFLTDIVLVTFWQRSMVKYQIDSCMKVLDIAGRTIVSNPLEKNHIIFEIVDWKYVQIVFSMNNTIQIFPEKEISKLLQNAVRVAAASASPVIRFEGKMWGIFSPVSRYVVLAKPVLMSSSYPSATGILLDLEPFYRDIFQKQKLILMYMLFNVMVLTVVGLFRMIKFIVKPLENLVQMTQNYRVEESSDFAVKNDGHEFRKLAFSLNSMVKRIENDREKLRKTVQSLSDANNKLKSTRKEIIMAEKMAAVGILSAGMAHEIGNPLGVIHGYLELLNDDNLVSEERKVFITNAIAEVGRVDHLIRRLLDFAGQAEEEEAIIDLEKLLDQVESMFLVHNKAKNIRYSRIMKCDGSLFVRGEKSLIQVLLNCFLNAVDAVELKGDNFEKTILLFCEKKFEDGAEVIKILIEDNGVGIEDGKLSLVFNPFFTTKKHGKGTGLGLSVSYSLIDALGGKIWIESRIGIGTTVHLVLPLYKNKENGSSGNEK
jgi:signal transduction histidine kinase